MPGLRPLLKIFGGMHYMRDWIHSLMPANYSKRPYWEACLGGGSLYLRKAPSPYESLNELNRGQYAVWKAVRDWPDDFRARLSSLSYSGQEFESQKENLARLSKPDVVSLSHSEFLELAVAKYAVLRMSRGGMGVSFAWSERLRGGKPGDLNAWENSIENILPVSARLRHTFITNKCCIELASSDEYRDNKELVANFDPPFLKQTDGGKRKSKNGYESDMTYEDHVRLLDAICAMKGSVMIHGYDSALYADKLKSWTRHAKEGVNNASQSKSKSKQVAVVWTNY
jgi:DNA adenine methylase